MNSPRPVLAVSACLFRGGDLLLVERGRAPFAGLLSLPGGRVEFGETLDAAILREVAEETGLAPRRLSFLHLHQAIALAEGSHAVIAVFQGELPPDAAPRAGDDAASLRFVAPGEVRALEAAGRTTPGLAAVAALAEAARQP
ncbi:NUDIX hydrolase [Aureimonas populi]|uniref:NUDIX hydrolase n=1 Tax=Aureimonas populi TaxID=1701758 RepID=A0ABW5CLK7_9HYPH|nr:NUDIX domain-containing protein [Aureimonas populi]